MFSKPLARTLAALGFHAQPTHETDVDLRAVFASADGETPTPAAPPPARIPPHQRHLYVRHEDALHGYSMGAYRPAASMLEDPRVVKKSAKKRSRAKPKGA